MSECKHEFVDAGAWMSSCRLCGMLELQKQLDAANAELDRAANELHRLGMKCSNQEDQLIAANARIETLAEECCEGFCKENGGRGSFDDCYGCKITQALQPPADELTRLGQEMGEYE